MALNNIIDEQLCAKYSENTVFTEGATGGVT